VIFWSAYELNAILGLFIHSFIIDNPGAYSMKARDSILSRGGPASLLLGIGKAACGTAEADISHRSGISEDKMSDGQVTEKNSVH